LEAVARDPRYVNVYYHGRQNFASGASGSLEALEFVQCLVETPLYRGLVAGELGEGVRLACIPNKGLPERGGFGVSHALKLSGFVRGLSVFLFVGYDGFRKILGDNFIVRTLRLSVGASLPSSTFGQFSVELESKYAGLHLTEAP